MKQKITNIILGVLIGSVITATSFIIYIKGNDLHPRPKGMTPQMAQGQMSNQNGTAPTGQKGDTNSGTTTQQAQTTANNSSTAETTTSTANNN
jgi:hypothetical protein